MPTFKHLTVIESQKVAHVQLNRPDKANALNETLWQEIGEAFQWIDETPGLRVAVLSGAGKHFCAGIDLQLLAGLAAKLGEDIGRNAEILRRSILHSQAAFNTIERCRKPVIAAIHGACLGAGVDIISACDLRYASHDAKFAIREIDMGMAADVGTLQRLPHIIGDGMMRELAYTGRNLLADEAARIGLVNRCYPDQEALIKGVMELAVGIAGKSPLAVRGTKEMLLYTRDHTVADSLNYVATWNASMLMSKDLKASVQASLTKQVIEYED